MASLSLVPLCTVELAMGELQWIGDGPAGIRAVALVSGGTVSGDRISGEVVASGTADWIVVNGTVGTVDVRMTIGTHDGALVYVSYGGRMDVTDGPGTSPIYVTPRFETSDERYGWLNQVQGAGVGTLDGGALRYEWFELAVPDARLL